MKVYNGWILKIEGIEWTVNGSIKMRSGQVYLLRNAIQGVRSIRREDLLSGMHAGEIQYVA